MPIVPVRLHSVAGSPAVVMALIDSGADCACFPRDWAEPLGINLSECSPRVGVTAGGENEQVWWPQGVRAHIAGVELQLTGVFADTPVALLGRQDFFRVFEVAFDERATRFTLTRYDGIVAASAPDVEVPGTGSA